MCCWLNCKTHSVFVKSGKVASSYEKNCVYVCVCGGDGTKIPTAEWRWWTCFIKQTKTRSAAYVKSKAPVRSTLPSSYVWISILHQRAIGDAMICSSCYLPWLLFSRSWWSLWHYSSRLMIGQDCGLPLQLLVTAVIHFPHPQSSWFQVRASANARPNQH